MATWLDNKWRLRTVVLRCCVVGGRHTATAIAAFLLRVAEEFSLREKVGVVRTDGASNCVGAGRVLGQAAGRGAPVATRRSSASGMDRALGGGGIPGGGGGASGPVGNGGARRGGGATGPDGLDGPGRRALPDLDDADDEGGDGGDLDDVGSDCGDPVELGPDLVESGGDGSGTGGDAAALATERADTFFSEIPAAFRNRQADHVTRDAAFLWQHARCATHTLQLSVRKGLSVPIVRYLLDKVRLVGKLCRTSTNFQEEMRLAVESEEARAAAHEGREPLGSALLVSRLIIDCPTRWGSAAVMLRRFLRVGAAVPAALSSYYHYTAVPARKKRVECPSFQEQAALKQLVKFLEILESASASLGSESTATSPMEETVYWYVRRAAAPQTLDCQAINSFKCAVVGDMATRQDRERLEGPNPCWFDIRVAAVLLDPFTKSFTFGDNPSTAATARHRAIDIICWMGARSPDATGAGSERAGGGSAAGGGDGGAPPPTKKKRTFASSLRAFAAEGTFGEDSNSPSVRSDSVSTVPIETEWEAYIAFSVDTDSEETAFSWWLQHEQLFPRVSLGARYLLPIPATSVASERVFSKAGRTVTKSRARLTGAHAEKYVVLNDNLLRTASE